MIPQLLSVPKTILVYPNLWKQYEGQFGVASCENGKKSIMKNQVDLKLTATN